MAGGHRSLNAVFRVHHGRVTEFDSHVGAGTVEDAAGHTWAFHCTRIADGSREIPAGLAVTFRVEPGPLGLEAVDISTS